jgi:hypothetical protein
LSLFGFFLGTLRPTKAHRHLCWAYVGPMRNVGLCWAHVGSMLRHAGHFAAMLGYVGPMLGLYWVHVGPMFGLCWAMLKPNLVTLPILRPLKQITRKHRILEQ